MVSFFASTISILDGFMVSNWTGRAIVIGQLGLSIWMFSAIINKFIMLNRFTLVTRRFIGDFASGRDVLDYYLQRRKSEATPLENIYSSTCDRLLKLLTPDARSLLIGRTPGTTAALTAREIELVEATCAHALDDETIRVKKGMGLIACIVMISPMLGLLGTVWGVLDAFYDMGTSASASLATLAPAISAALVTTVIGLVIALPGIAFDGILRAQVRSLLSQMEGFADELMGRMACEFQGKVA